MDSDDIFKLYHCYGRICSKCNKCRDWYYTGSLESWRWIQNCKTWTEQDWDRWRDQRVYDRFQERYGATCYCGSPANHDNDLNDTVTYRVHFLLPLNCLCCSDYFDSYHALGKTSYTLFGCLCDDNIKLDV